MFEIIEEFAGAVKHGQIEIYNEFSLQHELGIFLRSHFPYYKIQFERNWSFFFHTGTFIKKEIDIAIYSPDKTNFHYAVELKFPRNGQYPEQMFSFCRDLLFAEQLLSSGFKRTFLVIFADDPLFYSGKDDGIYAYFRGGIKLFGSVQKPTGSKDEIIILKGVYEVHWNSISGYLKYSVIEANLG